MKSKFAVLAFMLVMMSAAQAYELTQSTSPVITNISDYPEPRGLR